MLVAYSGYAPGQMAPDDAARVFDRFLTKPNEFHQLRTMLAEQAAAPP